MMLNNEALEFMRKNSASITRQAMIDIMAIEFDLMLSLAGLKEIYSTNNLKGINTRFKKGAVPWSAGKKIGTRGRTGETQFKKGAQAHNLQPIGSERITHDGFIQVKATATGYPPKDWVMKSRLVWEKSRGAKIPKGHILRFIDGDKQNLEPSNLLLVSRAEHCVMNRWIKINDMPKDGLITVHLLAKIKIAASKRGKDSI
jgi:hypothetical protein